METASKGLLKLMVRLPALRGELQILYRRDPALRELIEAYEEASHMLLTLRANPRAQDDIIREYEAVCTGIEDEIVERCSSWHG